MDFNNLRKVIEKEAKGTIGYKEAEDKKSFMTGVSVAISKMEQSLKGYVDNMESRLETSNNANVDLKGQLQGIADTLKPYLD